MPLGKVFTVLFNLVMATNLEGKLWIQICETLLKKINLVLVEEGLVNIYKGNCWNKKKQVNLQSHSWYGVACHLKDQERWQLFTPSECYQAESSDGNHYITSVFMCFILTIPDKISGIIVLANVDSWFIQLFIRHHCFFLSHFNFILSVFVLALLFVCLFSM